MKFMDWLKRVTEGDDNTIVEEPAVQATMDGLDFKAAVIAHQKWKHRLRDCIDGHSDEILDPRIICQDNQCILGRWINGQGAARYKDSTEFARLKTAHAEFHLCASEVLISAYAGKRRTAEDKLSNEFARLSMRVQSLLGELFSEASNRASTIR